MHNEGKDHTCVCVCNIYIYREREREGETRFWGVSYWAWLGWAEKPLWGQREERVWVWKQPLLTNAKAFTFCISLLLSPRSLSQFLSPLKAKTLKNPAMVVSTVHWTCGGLPRCDLTLFAFLTVNGLNKTIGPRLVSPILCMMGGLSLGATKIKSGL